MNSRLVRFVLSLLLAVLIAAVSTLVINWFWRFIGGGDLPLHGWIALLIGTFGTVGMAWGLMYLAFRSNREGWDERVDNSLDPGSKPSDDERS